ncbi:acyclic terpene utilization AtuA family protein [Xanthobacter sp. TB0139]|uniref:acyclic terpene utilization AtuA family protein n=1 Tax=Xanthobacter sp. TB0139 TaxID=3459178 RepID=UPI00403A0FAC
MRRIRIGTGAGYSGDRIDPAVDLAERGDLDYLVFECLGERTIALAQLSRLNNPDHGYEPLLEARMQAVLPACHKNGVKIVTNMGAANPLAAAEATARIAKKCGLGGLRIAAITGDDVLEAVCKGDFTIEETGAPVVSVQEKLVSANAYMGAGPIAEALAQGADVVILGRASDPALFLGPAIHAFGWQMDDWARLGRGTVAGHLLECGGQVTGGYFADPGYKNPPDLARLGMPIGELDEEGNLVITKLPGTGGAVTRATCTEQLLYEVHDPARYLQPDVVADFSNVTMAEDGPDRIRITGGNGHTRSGLLKVSLGVQDGWIGEGQISYAGPGATARGQLAADIVAERLRLLDVPCRETRGELIGVNAILGSEPHLPEPREVRMRFAARTDERSDAERIGREVEALYLNGPAGGGGAWRSTRRVIGVLSTLIPEHLATPRIHMMEA